jgi:acetaldehyde dehydrogenase (acetylating)
MLRIGGLGGVAAADEFTGSTSASAAAANGDGRGALLLLGPTSPLPIFRRLLLLLQLPEGGKPGVPC